MYDPCSAGKWPAGASSAGPVGIVQSPNTVAQLLRSFILSDRYGWMSSMMHYYCMYGAQCKAWDIYPDPRLLVST